MGGFLKIQNIFDRCKVNKPNVFVETGTYQPVMVNGKLRIPTIFKMSPLFKELHTIEIVKDIHVNSVNFVDDDENPYKNHSKKINFILGDSQKELKYVCEKIKEPAVFYLDGHFSADWNGVITGKSDNTDVPLYEELKIINDNFKHKAIVICDDLRLFGDKFKHGDWTHITKDGVKKMVKDRLINSFGNSVPDDSPWGMDSLILELKEID
tara:strand:+ start:203 stop:832 length:630 start_codon:yes stop_codon:yes gene_type:complete